jgi:hypothetical protein
MRYDLSDLAVFEPLLYPDRRIGTAYFEFHPTELPEEHACWLEGSMLLRDAAFDFFAECFHGASESFDYFAFVRFGPEEIRHLVSELDSFVARINVGEPSRADVFARYASILTKDVWDGVPTGPLALAVVGAGVKLRDFVDVRTKESQCLWVLGM